MSPAGTGLAGQLRGLANRVAGIPAFFNLLRIVMLVLIVVIVTPRTHRVELHFPASLIDTVARQSIAATHDFEVEDISEEELLEVRDNATRMAPQVWERDESVSTEVVTRVRDAAARGRELLVAEAERRFSELQPRPPGRQPTDATEQDGSAPGADAPIYAGEIELADALNLLSLEERTQLLQDADVYDALMGEVSSLPDDIRRSLAREAFAPPTVEAVIYQLLHIQRQDIVPDNHDAPARTEGQVVVRDAESGEESVRDAADFQRVSLADVHACPQRILTLPAQVADGELLHSVQRLACLLARPNVTYDPAQSAVRSEEARQQAMSTARGRSVRMVREGEVLVRAGQQITPTIHRRLQTMAATRPPSSAVNWHWVPVAVYTLATLLALTLIGRRWLGRQLRPKDEVMLLTILAFQLASTSLAKSLSPLWIEPGEAGTGGVVLGWSLLVPFMGGPMLVRLFRPLESAVFVAVAYSALAVPLLGGQPGVELMHVLGGVTAAVMIGQGRLRRDTVLAPAVALVVACLPVIGVMTVSGAGAPIHEVSALLWLLGASLAINTAVAVLPQPLMEGVFGMTSAARLKELGQEHALLDQLARQAGGTYSHSRMVGELCRAGCEAIGANGLLAEVGARFHDIGKLKRPEYFAENQAGVNVHDQLEPIQSAAILREHVSYGIELAISYGLPEEIIAFIREHHGTKLMGFYGKALKQGDAFEADFRYEGPRPSSRETALCLLADGIEAESRSKPREAVNEAYIRGLIKRHIRDAVSDDQLVDSGLSVRDLARVEEAFFHSMATELLQKRPQYDPLPTLDASDQLRVGRITATSDQATVGPHG